MSPSGQSGLGVLRRLRLRDVVLWTLLPAALCLYLLGSSIADYRRMAQFDDWWSNSARVDRFAWWRVRSLLQLPSTLALDQRLSVEDTQRPLVDLRVDRAEFDRIATDPLAAAGATAKAYLFEGNSIQEVELKLRGDTSVHWTAEKKTFAIKSTRGEMFHDSRSHVFSSKEVLAQFAANSMAQDFGLLAPKTAIVPVYLNQRFYGMFRAFAPLDETFLRNAGRIPGNIFRGDTAERGDYFKGLPRELFVNPYIWDRVANNDRPGAIGTAKLFDFVERVNQAASHELGSGSFELGSIVDSLNTHSDSALTSLFEILDRDEIARLLALDLVVGDPWHTSGVHNHFWYEDSSSGLLHPIPWDLRMLDLEHPPPQSRFNRFWRAALRDPRILQGALDEVWRKNRNQELLATVTERVESTWNGYRDGFEFDRLRRGPISDVGTPQQVLATLRKNLATLEGWCNDARASVAITPQGEHRAVIDIVVDGRAGIQWQGLELEPGQTGSLIADTDLDGAQTSRDRVVPLFGESPRFEVGYHEVLQPGSRADERLEREGLHYRYFLHTAGSLPAPEALLMINSITGTAVRATPLSAGTPLPSSDSVHPWRLLEPPAREMKLEGEVRLTQTLEIPRNTTLKIAAGTRLVLAPDVSIHCKGRIESLGSPSAPITFSSSDPLRPWGSLALWGRGADQSRFTHTRFSGGGGALLDDVEYTGMVCVHWASDVSFEDCEFGANQRCDDALHADVANVSLLRSWFHDANADSIDFDISTGRIENCKIERSGNDGFDLMTCSPELIGNQILDSGDKGISVGENSNPLIFANTIRGCQRGIEVKDRSSPVILNNTLEANRTGVIARLKNWRYERGGWPQLVRSSVSGNGQDLVLEPTARLTASGSRIGGEDDSATPVDLRWLYALQGIALGEPALGALTSWSTTPRALLVAEENYPDAWIAPAATWKSRGGITSTRLSDDCLVARMNALPGRLGRSVSWDLTDPTRTNWLVIEAAAVSLDSATLIVGRPGNGLDTAELRVPLTLASEPNRFAYTVVALPSGSWSSLAFDLQPTRPVAPALFSSPTEWPAPGSTPGQFRLHSWRVISAPTETLSPQR